MTADKPGSLHAGVAEHGKVCALRDDHVSALMHYREAMSMAVRQKAPEVVFRHYLECALESLEHMGAYRELLEYCDRAIEHYRLHPPESPLARFDLASIHQRRGVALLKQGERDAAARALEAALATARTAEARLTLAETLLRWLRAQLTVSVDRIGAEQVRHHYFSVRKETVIPSRAVPLPGRPPIRSSAIVSSRGEV
jgi:tetratricopeptide (TPR) repeat protein